MLRFPFTFILTYIFWLLLNFSLSQEIFITGFFVALVVSFVTNRFLFTEVHFKAFNPVRWLYAIRFFFLMLVYEIISHLDVMSRVFTGRINPGMVKFDTSMKTDVGRTLIANSITLTPGTLTMWTRRRELTVHCLNRKKGVPGRLFEKYGKWITE